MGGIFKWGGAEHYTSSNNEHNKQHQCGPKRVLFYKSGTLTFKEAMNLKLLDANFLIKEIILFQIYIKLFFLVTNRNN